jgi:hypothetical protein
MTGRADAQALLKAKNEEAAAKAKKVKEYAEAVEKMEKQIKSLASRGQSFTMDSKGEVLLVNELSGDKIPAPNVAVKSGLAPAPRPPDDPKFNAAAGGGAAASGTYFVPSDTVQPPAVESHVLSTGVTLKEAGQVREGPPRAKVAPAPPSTALSRLHMQAHRCVSRCALWIALACCLLVCQAERLAAKRVGRNGGRCWCMVKRRGA